MKKKKQRKAADPAQMIYHSLALRLLLEKKIEGLKANFFTRN
ncbi:MAG TPA: hypothetical protein VNR87_16640 [Flavisolibacter sp.]|nr:hypothetical protein [Flavisolibacter sp.]